MRDAWDGERLQARTVGRGPRIATNAHVSVLAHITREELERELLDVDVANGFANRFLFVLSRRSKRLPSGGALDDRVIAELGAVVRERLASARRLGILRRTQHAEAVWSDWYCGLHDDVHGMFGAVTARAEAQVLRLSVAYALADASRHVDVDHLRAALALWRYSEDSARYLFASSTGDPVADRLLAKLREVAPAGLDGKQQHELFHRHRTAKQLQAAREFLVAEGDAEIACDADTGGRPRIVMFAKGEQSEESELVNDRGDRFADSLYSQHQRARARVDEGFDDAA